MVFVSSTLPKENVSRLKESGYSVIPLPADPRLPSPVASHPDMLLFLTEDILITDRTYYYELAQKEIDYACAAAGLTAVLTDAPPQPIYPHDIRFNVAQIGTFCIGHPTHTATAILHYISKKQLTFLPTKQGYARCSVCPVGKHALITADPSIASASKKQDLDVCLIQQGHVLLPGYAHGLIGGCCGAIGHQLYFSGDPLLHPDGERMLSFIRSHGISPIALSEQPLFDGGSLLFLSRKSV